jgi:hypothetical protein
VPHDYFIPDNDTGGISPRGNASFLLPGSLQAPAVIKPAAQNLIISKRARVQGENPYILALFVFYE